MKNTGGVTRRAKRGSQCSLFGLVVMLSLSLGCGKSLSPQKTTIKVAYWGGAEEVAIIQDLVAPWQRSHPDVQVRLEHTPFSAYVSRLLTRMAGDVAPDIMAVEVNLFPAFWSKGAFLPLTPFIERDPQFHVDEFFPEVIQRFSVDGQLYAIPRDTAPFACVFYNQQLFNEAKIPYPTDEWTWEDLLRVSKQLTKMDESGRVSRYGFYAWAWQNFIYGNGGRLVDDLRHPTRCLLGEPPAVEGLQFYSDLMNRYQVAPTPVALGNLAMGAQQLFMTQRVAMFSSGFWEVPVLRQITDFGWDVVMFPKGPKGTRAFGTGGTGYAMLKSTKHPELAWEVLKALAGDEGQARLAQMGLAQPANRRIADSEAFAKSPLPPAHKSMLNRAVQFVVYEPFIPEWREISELHMLPELDLVFHGKKTAAQAAAAIVPKVNAVLAQRKPSTAVAQAASSQKPSGGKATPVSTK